MWAIRNSVSLKSFSIKAFMLLICIQIIGKHRGPSFQPLSNHYRRASMPPLPLSRAFPIVPTS